MTRFVFCVQTFLSFLTDIYLEVIGKMKKRKIDWIITVVPLVIILGLSILFLYMPEKSNQVLSKIRFFFISALEHT